MYLCTAPSEEYAIDLPSVCMFLCTSARVCVCTRGTDSLCFYMPELLLLALFRAAASGAVLEIHQPWQVHCGTTLHSLRPTTHTKISLSIRKTFVSGWRWIWKGCRNLKKKKNRRKGWKKKIFARKECSLSGRETNTYQADESHFCITFSLKIKFTFVVDWDSHRCQVWRWMLKIICVIGSAT